MAVHSMTGFAQAEARIFEEDYAIELRTLNHRFLEIKARLPKSLAPLETQIKQTLSTKITRGALELRVEKKRDASRDSTSLDEKRFAAQLSALQAFCSSHSLPPPTLSDVLTLCSSTSEEQIAASQTEDQKSEERRSILALLDKATLDLVSMRKVEGARLAKIILDLIGSIKSDLAQIEALRSEWKLRVESKVKTKVSAILEAFATESVPSATLEGRIAQELALIWDRTDVEEELKRLHTHFDHFEQTVNAGGSIGKKLDFLTQELGREVNTLNNKSQDIGIHHLSVEIKVKLEQLREQVQNIE